MKAPKRLYCTFAALYAMFLFSCNTIDVFEKNEAIPSFEWSSDFHPVITFNISDTASLYRIYAVIRHTDAYKYKNLWLNVQYQLPEETTPRNAKVELTLGDDEKGWLGSGMDDIFEHRILIEEPVRFQKPGNYTFTLSHIMREDPLPHVMNAGIRVEKIN